MPLLLLISASAYTIAKTLHIIGAFMVVLGAGALVFEKEGGAPRKLIMIFHGIGMLVLFLAGFAILGFQKYQFGLWVIVKLVIWLIFGASVVLAKKGIIFKGVGGWIAVIVLAAIAAAMAVMGVKEVKVG